MAGMLLFLLMLGLFVFPSLSSAQTPGLDDSDLRTALELVRGEYYEALPYSRARALQPAAVRQLATMLADPSERALHPNIVAALGMSGDPAAFAPLAELAAAPRSGALDSAEYRTVLAMPPAMGHLARGDPRALAWLLAAAGRPTATAWTYRHLDGERLGRILQRAAISGLGISGLPGAEAELRRRHAAAVEGSPARTHIQEAIDLCARVNREGPEVVFGAEPEPEVLP